MRSENSFFFNYIKLEVNTSNLNVFIYSYSW